MPAVATTVMAAIQGGVRLYEAVRRADIDATRARGLVLPLPRAPDPGDYVKARAWFVNDPKGRSVVASHPAIDAAIHSDLAPGDPRRDEVIAQYREWKWASGADSDGPHPVSSAEAVALLTVREWSKGETGAAPSPLQTVAGEIVNLAIDYFAHTPGAVSDARPEGRALKAVLDALDETDFKTADLSVAVGQIVLAVAGAVSKNPELLGGGEKGTLLVKGVTSALAKSADEFLKAGLPTSERANVADWLNLVGTAVLQGGVDTITANPEAFLGRDAGPRDQVVFKVTKTIADLVVGEDRKLGTRELLSGRGLTTVVQSAVRAIAENPDALGPDTRGLRTIVVGVMTDVLGGAKGLPRDLGPELVRAVLDRTAANLDTVWPDAANAGAGTGGHLLLTAAKSLLGQLSSPDGDDEAWRPTLTKEQAMGLVGTVLDEVVDNPAWVVGRTATQGGDDLGRAVAAALQALAAVPEASRLDGSAAATVIQAALLAVARNHALLAAPPATGGEPAPTALQSVISAIVGQVLDPGADEDVRWNLARTSVVTSMVEAGLDAAARHGASPSQVDALRAVVGELLASGGPYDAAAFASAAASALARAAANSGGNP